MLDEIRQKKLAHITPVGTNTLPIHIQLRNAIEEQQRKLQHIHQEQVDGYRFDQDTLETSIEPTMKRYGIERYGICEILDEYVYKNAVLHPEENQLLVIVIPMEYEKMITAPSLESGTELFRAYKIGGDIVLELTKKLREIGVQATAHHPLGDIHQYHQILLPPHAQTAGLGEKGRTGLFIDYELGPLVRLAAISMKSNLLVSKQQKRGIFEFCHRCRYCVDYCPPKALPNRKYIDQFASGEPMEFKINAQRCFKYFKKHQGCGRCIVHCILADPDKKTIARRMNRIEKWYHKWIESGELEKLYQKELQLS